MIVAKDVVVTLAYSVTDPDNAVIDEGDAPMVYLHGGYDNIFAKIEDALDGKPIGHTATISLEPDDAFGEYDAELLRVVALDELPDGVSIGMQFEGDADDCDDDDFPLIFTVTDIAEDRAVLDGNHPLAGVRLKFSCTITAIRPASPDEITTGQAEKLSLEIEPQFGRA